MSTICNDAVAEYIETRLSPIRPDFSVECIRRNTFFPAIQQLSLASLELVFARISQVRGHFPARRDVATLHLNIANSFRAETNQGCYNILEQEAFFVSPATPYTISSNNTYMLAVDFDVQQLRHYARHQLNCEPATLYPSIPTLALDFKASDALRLGIIQTFSTLSDPQTIGSSVIIREQENKLYSLLLATLQQTTTTDADNNHSQARNLQVAEAYLLDHLKSPVSRTELAQAACISISTLNRVFAHKHGVGPMQFLKQRRLDATYQALITADAEQSQVFEIAQQFSFTHPGRFAVEYKQRFGESPSTTLLR